MTRFEELNAEMCAPEIIADNALYLRTAREFENLSPIIALREKLVSLSETDGALSLAKELSDMISTDGISAIGAEIEITFQEKSTLNFTFIIELFDMYERFSKLNGFVFDGGCNMKSPSARIKITGETAFKKLVNEEGLHKSLASGGTCSAIVAVHPVCEKNSVDLSEKDLRIDIFRSGGKGGQNVNKVESAIRITHIPTGITVSCQDERSQLQNKERAKKLIAERVSTHYAKEEKAEKNAKYKDRIKRAKSTPCRNYDFISGKASNLKNNVTFNLSDVLRGDLC